jgi:hypothetical protein
LHVASVIGTLVFSALHHPPVWWWCWAALMLWLGERAWRLTRWLYYNGFVGSAVAEAPTHGQAPDKPEDPGHVEAGRPGVSTPKSSLEQTPTSAENHFLLPPPSAANAYVPPTGYAHVELLAGRTVRLTIATPGYVSWAPGQHFLVTVPCISRFLSHPFTCASLCDEQIAGSEGRTLVFLIRAKQGWTRDLWDTVIGLLSADCKFPTCESHPVQVLPKTGVLMRTWVDGPFGSCARNDWGAYTTAVLVAGGSGVSFTLAVMEYIALCMVGRNGRFLGGSGASRGAFKTDRIRFVWIVREFCELPRFARMRRALTKPDLQHICSGARRSSAAVSPSSRPSRSRLTSSSRTWSRWPASHAAGPGRPSTRPRATSRHRCPRTRSAAAARHHRRGAARAR